MRSVLTGGNMRIGDLVRHTVHTGAIGIVMATHAGEVYVRWLTNNWGEAWILMMNVDPMEEV